ncbi:hypothetical protein [Deinococcus sonorensis]|uniref:ArsR family transcriptional regulator n=2 Tax=Deinococcus sonorensis TaxID=309891 RepID=A0AAU7U6C9_9DEIO
MAERILSSLPVGTHVVSDSAAAAFLSDPRRQAYLSPFIDAEVTVSQVAHALSLPLGRAHYWTLRLLTLGLVRETRREARAGRAVRHYRAVASAFFVPFDVTGADTLETQVLVDGQVREQRFGSAIARAIAERPAGHGTLLTRDADAVRALRRQAWPDWSARPDVVNAWLERPLTEADAHALRSELHALLDRYARLPEPDEGRAYMLRLGLTPL